MINRFLFNSYENELGGAFPHEYFPLFNKRFFLPSQQIILLRSPIIFDKNCRLIPSKQHIKAL